MTDRARENFRIERKKRRIGRKIDGSSEKKTDRAKNRRIEREKTADRARKNTFRPEGSIRGHPFRENYCDIKCRITYNTTDGTHHCVDLEEELL